MHRQHRQHLDVVLENASKHSLEWSGRARSALIRAEPGTYRFCMFMHLAYEILCKRYAERIA